MVDFSSENLHTFSKIYLYVFDYSDVTIICIL